MHFIDIYFTDRYFTDGYLTDIQFIGEYFTDVQLIGGYLRLAAHRRAPYRYAAHRRVPHRHAAHRQTPYGCAAHRRAPHRRAAYRRALSAKLGRFSLAKPRNTLVSAVSSFTPARRCLLGVADGLAAPSQLKRHGNAVVNGFVYFAASRSGTFQLISTTS